MRRNITGITGGCGWSLDILMRVLAHEMGHTIGFTHPSPLEGMHIANTQRCTWPAGQESLCNIIPTYATVMSSERFWASNCTVALKALNSEDLASSQVVY